MPKVVSKSVEKKAVEQKKVVEVRQPSTRSKPAAEVKPVLDKPETKEKRSVQQTTKDIKKPSTQTVQEKKPIKPKAAVTKEVKQQEVPKP